MQEREERGQESEQPVQDREEHMQDVKHPVQDGKQPVQEAETAVPDTMAADPARSDNLVLVDALDCAVGTATKTKAHTEGLLHRAFSVVLVRSGAQAPELLLAQRAAGKYHSAGLWANSCCSHPRAGEDLVQAAYRRVEEELGCRADDLREIDAFLYHADFGGGMFEYEYDHVFVGRCEGEPQPDPTEVQALRWVAVADLSAELVEHPERFAVWAFTVLARAAAYVLEERVG